MANLIPLSEMANYYTPELRQFLTDLGEIAQTMNIVEMVTPVNAAEEKRKYLKMAAHNSWTNPVFGYDTDLLASVASCEPQLHELGDMMLAAFETVSNEQAGKVLCALAESRYREVEATINLAKCMLERDDRTAGKVLETIFGAPDRETVDAARNHIKRLADGAGKDQRDNANLQMTRQRLNAMEFDAEDIRTHFIWMTDQCGFAGTRPVEISETATYIDVRDKSSRGAVVLIPANHKVNGVKLVELTGHEVLCHLGDSIRAAHALPSLGSGALKPADEMLYEGHAALTDCNTYFNLGDKTPRQQAPLYILAINRARLGACFAEITYYIYHLIKPILSDDKAALEQTWKTCFRVFRGSRGDLTGNPRFAFTKDRAYFEGKIWAKQLHTQKLDSILELGTLSKGDIETLRTAVEFERKDTDQAQMTRRMWNMVHRLLDDKS